MTQEQPKPLPSSAGTAYTIRAGRLIDPETGTAKTDQFVSVKDGRIVEIGSSVTPPGEQKRSTFQSPTDQRFSLRYALCSFVNRLSDENDKHPVFIQPRTENHGGSNPTSGALSSTHGIENSTHPRDRTHHAKKRGKCVRALLTACRLPERQIA